jgi:hypothetical protein
VIELKVKLADPKGSKSNKEKSEKKDEKKE